MSLHGIHLIQNIIAGYEPNALRVYVKIAEWHVQQLSTSAGIPTAPKYYFAKVGLLMHEQRTGKRLVTYSLFKTAGGIAQTLATGSLKNTPLNYIHSYADEGYVSISNLRTLANSRHIGSPSLVTPIPSKTLNGCVGHIQKDTSDDSNNSNGKIKAHQKITFRQSIAFFDKNQQQSSLQDLHLQDTMALQFRAAADP